jgi:cytochrome P450
MSPSELVDTAILLLIAGHEATTNAIGNTVGAALQRPNLWRSLARRPQQLPAVVEEMIRYARFGQRSPISSERSQ